MALVSGSNRLDEPALAATLGGVVVGRADAAGVREATGYAIGGVPPFGHPTPLPTAIDEDLLTYGEVWAAAGTPRDVFRVDPADLVRLTGGTVRGSRYFSLRRTRRTPWSAAFSSTRSARMRLGRMFRGGWAG